MATAGVWSVGLRSRGGTCLVEEALAGCELVQAVELGDRLDARAVEGAAPLACNTASSIKSYFERTRSSGAPVPAARYISRALGTSNLRARKKRNKMRSSAKSSLRPTNQPTERARGQCRVAPRRREPPSMCTSRWRRARAPAQSRRPPGRRSRWRHRPAHASPSAPQLATRSDHRDSRS